MYRRAPGGDSYLNMAAILTVAVATGAQAIHPGYGLLSENAKFVSLCEQCNIAFIGPTSEMISLMGDKDMARKTMRKAGVPRHAWLRYHHRRQRGGGGCQEIGYPVLIKAKAGGGGRGIRLVASPDAFENAFIPPPARHRRPLATAPAIWKNI